MSVPADPEQNPPERQPAPNLPRIGDAERDRAVGFLQEHMAQGRLDHDEFDERLTKALQARTAADLAPLFDDLPEPRPSTGLATTSSFESPPWAGAVPAAAVPQTSAGASSVPAKREGMPQWAAVVMAMIWPTAITLFVLGVREWWIWVVAALLTYFIRQVFRPAQSPDEPPALEDGGDDDRRPQRP